MVSIFPGGRRVEHPTGGGGFHTQAGGIEGMLGQYLQDMLQDGMPEFDQDLEVEPSPMFEDLVGLVGQRMAGEGVGLGEAERQMMFERMQEPLEEERERLLRETMGGLQQRGLTDTGIAAQMERGITEDYFDALTGAQRDITLHDLQAQRQAQEQALGQAQQLSQMEQARQAGDIDRALQHWTQATQMAQMPFQMGMDYMTGMQLPREQMEMQQHMAELDRELEREGLELQERLSELDRELQREGWDHQARQAEMDRALQRQQMELQERMAQRDRELQREGWDYQARQAQLDREFQREMTELEQATRETEAVWGFLGQAAGGLLGGLF